MAEFLRVLAQNIIPQKDKLTLVEVNTLLNCKAHCTYQFGIAAFVGSTVSWIATRRLSVPFRIVLSAVAGSFAGTWRLKSSLESCIDQILALDGSLIQKELANIMVNKFPDHPGGMRLISKHFYTERVYDDTTSDKPKFRWRQHNFCVDEATNSQSTHGNSDNQSDSISDNQSGSISDDRSESNMKTNVESKRAPVKSGINTSTNPFDCIFGDSDEEHSHPDDASNMKPRIITRSSKRSQRKRRLHRQDVSETVNI